MFLENTNSLDVYKRQFHRRTSDNFLKESAKILFIHSNQIHQIANIYLLFTVLLHIGQSGLDRLNPTVMILLRYFKQTIRRQNCQNPKQR